jgi:hypothetical protein
MILRIPQCFKVLHLPLILLGIVHDYLYLHQKNQRNFTTWSQERLKFTCLEELSGQLEASPCAQVIRGGLRKDILRFLSQNFYFIL